MGRRVLLACGLLSSVLYVAMNVAVPMQWPDYDWTSQAVSELSAIGAPTRALWVPLGMAYALLVIAFGLGVSSSGARSESLRRAGVVLTVYGVIGLAWPPMHLRGAGTSLTDTLHIVFSMVTVLLMLLAMSAAARGLGWAFRVYSIVSLLIIVSFGIATALDAPNVPANLPTPWMGVWERISIGAFMLWVAALAVRLLRNDEPAARLETSVPQRRPA